MPIYEYECLEKSHRFEVMQKIADRPLTKCEVCGGKAKKVISTSSFSLKGGGWYKDGYGKTGDTSKKTESSTATTTKPKVEVKK